MSGRRGQLIAKGPGKWLLRVYRGTDDFGKKQYASKGFTGTTAQARQALTALAHAVDTDAFVVRGKLTVGEYLDAWLKGKLNLSPKTVTSYSEQLRHIKRSLGSVRLTDLDSLQVRGMVAELVKRGLSPRSVSYAVRVLRGALTDALREGMIAKNPAAYVPTPRQVKRPASVLSMAQVSQLLDATASSPYGTLWRLLLTSGMRPQEAFALKWSDLDMAEGWVSIRRALVSDGHGLTRLSERTKADSQRRLSLPASTMAALKAHRQAQASLMLSRGADYHRQDLIFTNRDGNPLDVSKVRRAWKAALKRCGLHEIRLYDTRHTHLTALLQNGVDIAFVSARAGHRDISMTVAHYAHVMPEGHRQMAEVMERILEENRG